MLTKVYSMVDMGIDYNMGMAQVAKGGWDISLFTPEFLILIRGCEIYLKDEIYLNNSDVLAYAIASGSKARTATGIAMEAWSKRIPNRMVKCNVCGCRNTDRVIRDTCNSCLEWSKRINREYRFMVKIKAMDAYLLNKNPSEAA